MAKNSYTSASALRNSLLSSICSQACVGGVGGRRRAAYDLPHRTPAAAVRQRRRAQRRTGTGGMSKVHRPGNDDSEGPFAAAPASVSTNSCCHGRRCAQRSPRNVELPEMEALRALN